jgi:hypothetical protein
MIIMNTWKHVTENFSAILDLTELSCVEVNLSKRVP